MMYEIPFKSKITITCVVYKDSVINSTGITSFPIRTCRPKIFKDEFSLCEDVIIDNYMVYLQHNTEQYKSGDLIIITGSIIIVKSFENLTCPLCGQKVDSISNPRFSILADVIQKKEIPNTLYNESNYYKALKYLEKSTNKNNWNNIIEIEEIETTSYKSIGNKKFGDLISFPIYKDIMMSAIYQFHNLEFEPDNYKGTYSFVGNLALVKNYYDSFNCNYCDSYVKIDNKIPYLFCLEKPKIKTNTIFSKFKN